MSPRETRVLITGASSGLGRELARLYAADGRHLVVTARRKECLLELKRELEGQFGIEVFAVAADLADPAAPDFIFRTLEDEGLTVDALVNNAGVGVYGEFLSLDYDQVARMYQINVLAAVRLIRLFLPAMVASRRGCIVNVASMGAFFPGPLMSVYFASKADLCSLTAAIGYELREKGVKFSAVCPGPFRSEFQQEAFGSRRDRSRDARLRSCRQIALEVFGGIRKQKRLIIPGIGNKLIFFLRRFLPQSVIMAAVFERHRPFGPRLTIPPLINEGRTF